MNAEQIAKLKEVALKAPKNPGEWPFYLRSFQAAATPAVILELISLAERTTAQDEVLTKIPRFNIDVDAGGDDIQEVPYPTGDFCRFEDVQALLAAAAPAPIQQGQLVEVGQMIEFDDYEDPRFHTIMCDWDNEARAKLTAGTKIYAASAGSQVQAAGDEVNEREAFEAMVKERFVTTEHSLARAHPYGYYNTVSSNTFGGRRQPDYANVQMLWDVWDARATIAKKAMREQQHADQG